MHKSISIAAILILVLFNRQAISQGSGSSRAQTQGSGSSRVAPPGSSQLNRGNPAVPSTPRPPTLTEFASTFWKYMNNPKKPYRKWGTPGKARLQGMPQQAGGTGGTTVKFHGKSGQTFLNDAANQNIKQLPIGSVLVREEYAADGKTVKNVLVMYRAKTGDPKNGKWFWTMYRRDGIVAVTSPEQGSRPIVGRVQSCIQCHTQSGGGDYVFLNDRVVSGRPPTNPTQSRPGIPPNSAAGSGSRR